MIYEFLFFCSLIAQAPYYDCSEVWVILVMDTDEIKAVCDPDTYACVTYNLNIILLPQNTQGYVDGCGRSALHHEILHLINPHFPKGEDNPIHNYDMCRNFWFWN